MARNNKTSQTLKTTMMRKEFWVGLVTTVIVLLVGIKLIPWNTMHKFTANNATNTTASIPAGADIASNGAMMTARTASPSGMMNTLSSTPAATSSAMMDSMINSYGKKHSVATLADTTGGFYTVQNGDNYYVISVKACGTGKYFESISDQNDGAALYAGNEVMVDCSF